MNLSSKNKRKVSSKMSSKKEGDIVIDLAKIIAEKRHIENEPILLRDILPKVMNGIHRQRRCRAIADSCEHPSQTPATAIQDERRQLRSYRANAGSGIQG